MAGFMLGSFTGGLFGGASDVMDIAHKWEGVKQARMETQRQSDMMKAAEQTRQALQADQGAQNAAAAANNPQPNPPFGKGGEHSSSGRTYTEADLKGIPQSKSLSGIDPNAPTKTNDTRSTARALKPGEDYSSVDPYTVGQDAAKAPSMTIPTDAGAGGGYDNPSISGAIGRGISTVGRGISSLWNARVQPPASQQQAAPYQPAPGTPQPRTEAPRYLLDGTPAGPPGSTPPVAAGQPASATPIGPQSALPYSTPTLGNSMGGLGPRILAAINPTAGSNT